MDGLLPFLYKKEKMEKAKRELEQLPIYIELPKKKDVPEKEERGTIIIDLSYFIIN